jgi:hypothetical protein
MFGFNGFIFGVSEALPHREECGQSRPQDRSGGYGHDQKPPDHPHDDLA